MAADAGGAESAASIPEFGLPPGPPPAGAPRIVTLPELDQFIADNRLDDKAAQNLRAEPPNIQRAVIDRGSLVDCLNPSSAVIGRIRDAKLQAKYGTSGAPQGNSGAFDAYGGGVGGYGGGMMGSAPMGMGGFYGAQSQVPMMPMVPMMTPPLMSADPGHGSHLQMTSMNSGPGLGAPAPEPLPLSSSDIELFIQSNRLDTTAAQNLRAEPPHIQRIVIDRGSLAECVNPSSALIGRIRDAKLQAKYAGPTMTGSNSGGDGLSPWSGCGGGSSGAPMGALTDGSGSDRMAPPGHDEVEAFIAENRLDESASQNLRSEPPQVQAVVIRRGSLAFCLNPSSALIGRIRDAKLQVKYGASDGMPGARGCGMDGGAWGPPGGCGMWGGMGGGCGPTSSVELFISDNRLDDGAARALRAEPQDVQAEVVGRGSLLACTNPSSAVMGRIREARRRPGGYGAMPMGMGFGDWGRASPY